MTCEIDLTLGGSQVIDLSLGASTVIDLALDGSEIDLTLAATEIDLQVAASEIQMELASVGIQGPPGPQGPAGPQGATSDGSVQVAWDTPSIEAANAIEISGTVKDANGDLVTSAVDFQIVVTDGAADGEPSATATITAASSPVGTILAGVGTATAIIRAASGLFAVAINETAAAHRYLWVSGAGHERLLVRAAAGVQELIFT